MHVRLADGGEFDQYRSTLCTIKSVPEQVGLIAGSGDSAQPASAPPRLLQSRDTTTSGQSVETKSALR
jgi:hypothetical protein